MNRIEQFNQMMDGNKHKYVIVPITENVGYMKPDDNGSGWGNWHIKPTDVVFADKVQIELD